MIKTIKIGSSESKVIRELGTIACKVSTGLNAHNLKPGGPFMVNTPYGVPLYDAYELENGNIVFKLKKTDKHYLFTNLGRAYGFYNEKTKKLFKKAADLDKKRDELLTERNKVLEGIESINDKTLFSNEQ